MNKKTLQSITRQLSLKTGDRMGGLVASAVGGGNINQVYRLSDGRHQYFVKTNRLERLSMFEAEFQSLTEIRQSHTIRAPKPILCGVSDNEAFLVMEFLEIAGRPDGARLAQQLAALHQTTQSQFGFRIDNTIGSSLQPNTYDDDWVCFWRQHRLEQQLSLVEAQGCSHTLLDAGQCLSEQLDCFFEGYTPQPSLLHGDLWNGNQGADAEGIPMIFDPACYYGDHEADLAMMELFGGPERGFFETYHAIFPIDPGYDQRRNLYNLYHILNHANLFGGCYHEQALIMMRQLLAEI